MGYLNIGDKVMCVDPPASGQLTKDIVYTVTYAMDYAEGQLISVNKWPWMMWWVGRFIKHDKSTQYRDA